MITPCLVMSGQNDTKYCIYCKLLKCLTMQVMEQTQNTVHGDIQLLICFQFNKP